MFLCVCVYVFVNSEAIFLVALRFFQILIILRHSVGSNPVVGKPQGLLLPFKFFFMFFFLKLLKVDPYNYLGVMNKKWVL